MNDDLEIPYFLLAQNRKPAIAPLKRARRRKEPAPRRDPRRAKLEKILGRLPNNMDEETWAFAAKLAKETLAKRAARFEALRALRDRR